MTNLFRQSLGSLLALLLWLALPTISLAENNPNHSDVLWVTIPSHTDWLYKTGEQASVEVTFLKYGMPCDAEIQYEIGPELMPATTTGTLKLSRGRATLPLGTMKKAGFLDCRLTATDGGKTYRHHVKVGFSPEQLKPYAGEPRDFDDYWTAAIEEARKQPVAFTMEKVEAYSDDEIDCYLVHLKTDKQGHSIYGYLTRPKAKGSYPVMLCPPGAGIKTIKEPLKRAFYARNGFIRLEMEIHGLNPTMSEQQFKEISSAFSGLSGYIGAGLDNPQHAYMRHIYAGCIRALDFLCQQEEWDGKNVFVQGGSQGGALAIITAGLDRRVTGCIANHPALSDMAASLDKRADGYPHFAKQPSILTPQNVKTLEYLDVVNFAKRVTCPVYMTWGYNDNTCPPTTSWTVWNLLTCPKESLITPHTEHWVSSDTDLLQLEWAKKHLK